MSYDQNITINPEIRSGKPCVRGTRITVSDILEYLASGMGVSDVVSEFPELNASDVQSCLAFAAERERKLFDSSAA